MDLVNCKIELSKSNQKIEDLVKELETSKSRIEHLERNAVVASCSSANSSSVADESKTRQKSLTDFRADLKAKREARQRALSAVSLEMNTLREELKTEKALRRKLERELKSNEEEKLLSTSSPPSSPPDAASSMETVLSDNNSLKNEIDILTENVQRLESVSSENIKLKFEIKRLNSELDSMNLNLGELKFEYYEEKRKHENTQRKLNEIIEKTNVAGGKTVDDGKKSDWEEEREKLFEKYDQEKEEIMKRTNALKEVLSITRQMLSIRECQVQELKVQLRDIEESVKKTKIMEENGLKVEYEKQLENIKSLKVSIIQKKNYENFERTNVCVIYLSSPHIISGFVRGKSSVVGSRTP